ncbi:hypothetical protein R3P38DRAFT_3228694 [Favolaschia claudopus]|uniref:F-box domain-containing protein n=1 Tax=Favolaschia claudopus TaxID=2862362 RepID=A0AAV9ZQD5_9AGAR
MANPLHVQELLENCIAFVTFRDDLASCSTVAWSWCSAAQKQLYFAPHRHIRSGLRAENDDRMLKFCDTLIAHPHLISLVRRLDLHEFGTFSLSPSVIEQICRIRFTHLKSVVLDALDLTPYRDQLHSLGSVTSVRSLKLSIGNTFASCIEMLRELALPINDFHLDCSQWGPDNQSQPAEHSSLIQLSSLTLTPFHAPSAKPPLRFGRLYPFDLSGLTRLRVLNSPSICMESLPATAQTSISVLEFMIRRNKEAANLSPFINLTTLRISLGGRQPHAICTTLRSISSQYMRQIVLRLNEVTLILLKDSDLDEVLHSLSCSMGVEFRFNPEPHDWRKTWTHLQELLPISLQSNKIRVTDDSSSEGWDWLDIRDDN